MKPRKIGLVGVGKIARDQHIPALRASPDFTLTATVSHVGDVGDLPNFRDIPTMLASVNLDALVLCTPPEGRFDQATAALEGGCHVMLEKPPGTTLSELDLLQRTAHKRGSTLFATWHSREAAGVGTAARWLEDRRIDAARIVWREDVRRWHPGQDWIMTASGFGVFDPGINALSIATAILPDALLVRRAAMVVPTNRSAAISASVDLRCGDAPVSFELDFLETGQQTWDIEVDTDAGTLALREGGRSLQLPGSAPVSAPDAEYSRLYARFAALIDKRESDVDLRPFRLLADILMVAERCPAPPFHF